MKMTVTINTIEINDEELQHLQHDNPFLITSSPQLLFPQNKMGKKRNRKVTASQIISELIQGLEK